LEITLVRSSAARKDPRLVIYNIEGRTGSVQFLSTLFGGTQTSQGNPPERMTLVGEFAPPRVKETPAERKARLALLPKLTPAEKIAKAEERLAKMKMALVAGSTAPAEKAVPPAHRAIAAKTKKR